MEIISHFQRYPEEVTHWMDGWIRKRAGCQTLGGWYVITIQRSPNGLQTAITSIMMETVRIQDGFLMEQQLMI